VKSTRLVTTATALLAAATMAGCANTAAGPSTAATKAADANAPAVTIMVGGLSKQIYLPFMLAKQLGYYDKAGVNVNLVDEPAGGDATENMLAGQVQGVGGFYDHNIALQAQNKSSESVVSMLQIPGEVELCRSDLKGTINGPADFKGQALGITDTGSSTDFLSQYLTTKAGVDPSTTTRRGVGAGQTFIAAMKQKAIACGMTTEPTVSQALSDGTAFILLDMRTAEGSKAALGGTYPATSLYMPTDYVTKNKDTVQKLVNAYVSTLTWIQQHSAAEIADKMPADYYKGVGKDAYVAALNSERGIFNPTGIMPADGPNTCLAVLSKFNDKVKGKSIDLKATYTDDFVKAATPVN